MAIIRCKMCGGDVDLAPDKTFGTCECCGNTMTFPKVDDDQRASAFNRGNHFRRIGEFDKALAVYERIVREDDTDAEAHWCCALCRFGIEYVEDPATYEWLPTCHRASFDSFLEDVDYLAALEHSDGITRRQYQKDAAKIAEVQRGILATSQNAEPYDVFICYKESDESGSRTRDSLLAQDIYYQLTEQGRKVFFARITLEDVVGTQYEPYIFAALNSAKVMIVVGTKPEYLNAVWVKNEWSRFLALMKKDRSKLLLPCYRDMDPYDLPEQLSVLQSYDMGKIGFIQDLIRGVSKVLDAAKPAEKSRETVVVQQAATHQSTIAPLMRRGDIALEDADWTKADEFFEEVLNHDPECVDAYIGKALAELKCSTLQQLVKRQLERTAEAKPEKMVVNRTNYQHHIDILAKKYAVEDYYSEADIRRSYDLEESYGISYVKERKKQLEQTKAFWEQNRNLSRAIKYEQGKKIQCATEAQTEVLSAMQQRLDTALEEERAFESRTKQMVKVADEKILKGYDQAVQKRCERIKNSLGYISKLADIWEIERKLEPHKEHPVVQSLLQQCLGRKNELLQSLYEQACEMMQKAEKQEDYKKVGRLFLEIGDYKDSVQLVRKCGEQAQNIRAWEMEEKRKQLLEQKKRLLQEKQQLEQELQSMSKLFGGKRRKEIETRLYKINYDLEYIALDEQED